MGRARERIRVRPFVRPTVREATGRVTEKPRLLVIERDTPSAIQAGERLADAFDVVIVRTVARAMVLPPRGTFSGVYVDAEHLDAVRLAGVQVQADEILDAIADGVALVDPELIIVWSNPEFAKLVEVGGNPLGLKLFRALGNPEPIGPEACPFVESLTTHKTCSRAYRTVRTDITA